MVQVELWGGIECSYNRVGDKYFDQLGRNGHDRRLCDLDLFAAMGIKKMRYPVLWEQIAPEGPAHPDWTWTDERLTRLQELNIEPIVGLVHHGSGPAYTSLISPDFPAGLAHFAAQVAERYPWVKYYTPVNEPLTTARFSGLYGIWYPHGKSDTTFVRALYNQVLGTKLAMEAIWQVNPAAQLVQTEDLGQTQSTPLLAYQANFENARRWLSLDMLCGKVNPQHVLWQYLRDAGLSDAELFLFIDNPLPPDIIGINHYITSERYLDQNLIAYPMHTHGTNGYHKYADVETVRVKGLDRIGVKSLLEQVWDRYNIPISITEAHICCTREEQMRWFKEVWDAAAGLKQEGKAIEAVTAWALLGSFDWNSLLTQERNHYESGVFDMRGGHPRPTALVKMLTSLAQTGGYLHPVLNTKGWWDREERYVYKHKKTYIKSVKHKPAKGHDNVSPILITGATGTLGQAFARICKNRGLAHKLLNRQELDIADPYSVEEAIRVYKPWAIINAAGYVRVDEAENDTNQCYRENTDGPAILAEKCKAFSLKLLTLSSDLVFNGLKEDPYNEEDVPDPRNVYGSSKSLAEQEVLKLLPSALVIRTSAFFGVWDKHNFVYQALHAFVSDNKFTVANDVSVSPTFVPDLVNNALDLLVDDAAGIWHLTNKGAYTWAQLARLVATVAKIENINLEELPVAEMQLPAFRPRNTVLTSLKADIMPTVEDALYRCVHDVLLQMQHENATLGKQLPHSENANIFQTTSTGTD
jgi:dTDP-4-dehydrorhamnose reductase